MTAVAAVDLGASSGRVMLAEVGPEGIELTEAHRFANLPVHLGKTLYWDVPGLYRGILDGLRVIGRRGPRLASIGVDSWAVDYGLLDADGSLLGLPVHYRDHRTDGVTEWVLDEVPADRLYAVTGLQLLPINTLFQVMSEAVSARLAAARHLLLIPDLISYWLTGVLGTERTNASTTQLLDIHSGHWATGLMAELGIRAELFSALREPGDPAGELTGTVTLDAGLPGPVPVTAVGSHDTASAVVAVPATGERFGYVSCGTWSLVGVELSAPVLTEESRLANFTNEGGVDGTIRYLRNVMGLWLLQESRRAWGNPDLDGLLAEAAGCPPLRSVIDPGDPVFLAPGDIPARIRRWCADTGQPEPATPAETTRCVLDSLALAYRNTLRAAQRLSGKEIEVVHLVGGGVRNELLCQLTADACGLPVVAGPAEATALGNALVQARAVGAVRGGLPELRALVRAGCTLRRYTPCEPAAPWDQAATRLPMP